MDSPKTREEAMAVCKLWGVNEPERMSATTPEEAISDYTEDWDDEQLRDATATIHLTGYAPMKVTVPAHVDPLAHILEVLDEEYGDPDNDGDPATPGMIAAEQTFIAAVLAEYEPYQYEDIYHETINVAEWIRANRPEWLEESK